MKILLISTKQRLFGYMPFVNALNSEGIAAQCVSDMDYLYLNERKPFHIVPTPRLFKQIKDYCPDFVLTDSPYYIPQITKLVGHRVLYHMRGAEEGNLTTRAYDQALYPKLFARMYTTYLAKIIVPSIKKTDIILPNSMWLQRQVEQLVPNHPNFVLYVGIDPNEWVLKGNGSLNLKHPAVSGVFQFDIYAKVAGLMKFMKVAKKMPNVNFYLAGEGPYSNLVKEISPSNVFFLGKLSHSNIGRLLETSDLFVHPSGLDALPRSVKEAALMEKAIVASNVGGIPEIVRDSQTGFLCNIDDPDDWIEKISFLIENPDVARKFGKQGHEFLMETFSWKKITSHFLKNLIDFESKAC